MLDAKEEPEAPKRRVCADWFEEFKAYDPSGKASRAERALSGGQLSLVRAASAIKQDNWDEEDVVDGFERVILNELTATGSWPDTKVKTVD